MDDAAISAALVAEIKREIGKHGNGATIARAVAIDEDYFRQFVNGREIPRKHWQAIAAHYGLQVVDAQLVAIEPEAETAPSLQAQINGLEASLGELISLVAAMAEGERVAGDAVRALRRESA